MKSLLGLTLLSLAMVLAAQISPGFTTPNIPGLKKTIVATVRDTNNTAAKPNNATFFLKSTLPAAAGTGVFNPFAGLFYFGSEAIGYCGTGSSKNPCKKYNGNEATFLISAIDGFGSILFLNTFTNYPSGKGAAPQQEVYIASTGELRFIKPPQIFLLPGDIQADFNITKGLAGKPDTLKFTGPTGPAPFYSCVSDAANNITQIFVGVPGFVQRGCVPFVPEVHYVKGGMLEWT